MFTKKHYEVLAKLIHEAEDLNDFTNKLVEYLTANNPQFDLEKFIRVIIKG